MTDSEDNDTLTLEGTTRLNTTGGSGSLTVPGHITDYYLEQYGKDYAVFSDGERLLFVPRDTITAEVQE